MKLFIQKLLGVAIALAGIWWLGLASLPIVVIWFAGAVLVFWIEYLQERLAVLEAKLEAKQ
jgi:hypothetical protein